MRGSNFMRLLVLITLCNVNNLASEQPTPLVTGGYEALTDQWPWLVSLHTKMQHGPDRFFCGSSLINEWTLVTAAHCIKHMNLMAKHVRALLGRLNITNEIEEGWTRRNISTIKIHEDYGRTAFADSDIAILLLSESVTFTEHIKPIKLPRPTDDVSNKTGVVVGYGKINEKSQHQSTPNWATLHVGGWIDCYMSHNNSRKTVASNSFCAKSSVSVPCVGDSGGPFMVEFGNVWMLFGVVSYAFNDECNARDFAVFTDVTYFVDWILSNSGSFICISGGRIVPLVKYCDGVSDCDDGSDERHCVRGEVKRADGLLGFYAAKATQIDDEDFGIASARDESVAGFYQLDNTKAKFLPIFLDEKFPNLKDFEVTLCSIQKVSGANFKNLKKLEKLDLYSNEITSIEANSFVDLNALKWLIIGRNRLKVLDANLFKNLLNLNELGLYDNQIASLPESAFETLSELREVRLNQNQLTSLSTQLFNRNKKLVRIYLHLNQIEEISSNFFADMTELEVLILYGNQISFLPLRILDDSTKLMHVQLDRNNLKVLAKEVFQFNKKLKQIILSSNQLEKIDEKLFDGMENLTYVDLRANKCINEEFGDFRLNSNSTLNLLELKSEIKANCS